MHSQRQIKSPKKSAVSEFEMIKSVIMSQDIRKRTIKVLHLTDKEKGNDLKQTNPTERWMMMWQLALDAWAFRGEGQFAEPRLSRHTVRILRRTS